MDTITSFYKFVKIEDPEAIRLELKILTGHLALKGTILLANEGINGTVSGRNEQIEEFKKALLDKTIFRNIEFKDSAYDNTSFRRMLVKVKKEIITMRKEVDPLAETGFYLDPLEFKKWQDEGREMIILDTRNDYEVAMGTFRRALDPQIKSFGDFPKWVDQNLHENKDQVIVTFCTGGIRCEKATAYMKKKGFKKVYQLKGGILKYFEETLQVDGDNYWEGDCVVFDKRKAVNKQLEPTDKSVCYVCLSELTPANQAEESYPGGEACRSCGENMKRHHAQRLQRGLSKHEENRQRREEFLKQQRQKYKARG